MKKYLVEVEFEIDAEDETEAEDLVVADIVATSTFEIMGVSELNGE